MANTLINRVRWSDGIGITSTDLNDAQKFRQAYLDDLVLGQNIADWYYAPNIGFRAGRVYARSRWNGAPAISGTALRSTNSAGLIYVAPNNTAFDGQTPHALGYYLAADETQVTHAAGNASNPRWDIVYVSLAEGSRDTQLRDFKDGTTGALSTQSVAMKTSNNLTVGIVQGTAAATPTLPALSTGQAALRYVYVPANYSTAFTDQHIYDARFPMQFKSIYQPASAFLISSSATVSNAGAYYNFNTGSSQPTVIYAICPDVTARILGFTLNAQVSTGSYSATMGHMTNLFGGFTATVAAGGALQNVTGRTDNLDYQMLLNSVPNQTVLWGDGRVIGPYTLDDNQSLDQRACARITAVVSGASYDINVYGIDWHLAY